MQDFRRADGGPEVESGYARCQILRAMPPSLSSFVTTTAGAVFHRFFAMRAVLFLFYTFGLETFDVRMNCHIESKISLIVHCCRATKRLRNT